MAEAIFLGCVAALSFIGFISVTYYIVLYIYKPKKCGTYILTIPENASRQRIGNLIYGVHLRNMLFGDLIVENIIIFDNGLTKAQKDEIIHASAECGGIEICSEKKLIERLTENGR